MLSLAVAPDGDYCFSGGIDATIRCWNMPHSTVDPYDSYGKIYLMLESKNDIGVPILVFLTALQTSNPYVIL